MGNSFASDWGADEIKRAALGSKHKPFKATLVALKSTENSIRNRELNKSSGDGPSPPKKFSWEKD